MIKVLFVCHGNICRSPMAESIFAHLIKEKKIEKFFSFSSAATSREEIGNLPHKGTINVLNKNNIKFIPHIARQITKDDIDNYDYILVMDDNNVSNLKRMFGSAFSNVYKLLYFKEVYAQKNIEKSNAINFVDFSYISNIADPWYTGNFEDTYTDIMEGLNYFLQYIMDSGKV